MTYDIFFNFHFRRKNELNILIVINGRFVFERVERTNT